MENHYKYPLPKKRCYYHSGNTRMPHIHIDLSNSVVFNPGQFCPCRDIWSLFILSRFLFAHLEKGAPDI